MDGLFDVIRWVHIAVGTLALGVGPAAMAATKGGPRHRLWGRIYVASMALVGVSALVMAARSSNVFLLLVAVFSSYLAVSGWRSARRHGGPASGLDLAFAAVTLAASAALLGWGGLMLSRGGSFGTVLVVFGGLGTALAGLELREARAKRREPGAWLRSHVARMLGAYIATLTAFSAVNLGFLPPVVAWLWPTALIAPMIPVVIRRHRRKAALRVKGPHSPAREQVAVG